MMVNAIESIQGLEKLAIVYLEKGHTQNENDSVHSCVEQAKRNIDIFVPAQYPTVIRGARKSKAPYNVIEMTMQDFENFQIKFKNTATDDRGEKVKWRQIRQIAVSKDAPTRVFFAYNHEEQFRTLDLYSRLRGPPPTRHSVQKLYTHPLPITKKKHEDLLALCEAGAIPGAYHQYYRDLPVGNLEDEARSCTCDRNQDEN